MSTIKVENISKSFGKVKALDGISFEVERGELFGLIGPDGAGKTTLFRLLTTLLNPDEGQAEVDGFDIVKEKSVIVYYQHRLTLKECLVDVFENILL